MSSEYNARSYQSGDEEQIVSVLISAFGIWPFFDISCTPSEHWRWRYNDKPQHDPLIFVVPHKDRIISSTHSIIHNVRIYGREALSSYNTDACVHPDFQGIGISKIHDKAILEAREKADVQFSYMVTDNPITMKSSARKIHHPYTFPFNVSYLTRIENINQHISAIGLQRRYMWKLKHHMDRAISQPIKSPEPDINILEVNIFDQRIEGFLEKVFDSYDFILHRSKDYLNWRYCDKRAGDYKLSVVEENGQIIGYSVVRINKNAVYNRGYIVDLLTLPNRLDVAESLLLAALSFFKEEKVNLVSYQVIKNHPNESLSLRYGFKRSNKTPHMYYNYVGEQMLQLETIPPHKIHFSMGDMTEI